jgi:hypothetical protein
MKQPAYKLAEEAVAEWLKRHQRDIRQATETSRSGKS